MVVLLNECACAWLLPCHWMGVLRLFGVMPMMIFLSDLFVDT